MIILHLDMWDEIEYISVVERVFILIMTRMHAGAKTTRAFKLGIMDLEQQYSWCMHY